MRCNDDRGDFILKEEFEKALRGLKANKATTSLTKLLL